MILRDFSLQLQFDLLAEADPLSSVAKIHGSEARRLFREVGNIRQHKVAYWYEGDPTGQLAELDKLLSDLNTQIIKVLGALARRSKNPNWPNVKKQLHLAIISLHERANALSSRAEKSLEEELQRAGKTRQRNCGGKRDRAHDAS